MFGCDLNQVTDVERLPWNFEHLLTTCDFYPEVSGYVVLVFFLQLLLVVIYFSGSLIDYTLTFVTTHCHICSCNLLWLLFRA